MSASDVTPIHTARPGETAMDLPLAPDAGVYFIGRIRTPWTERSQCPKNVHEAKERGALAHAQVDIEPRYALALDGLSAFTHIWLLYWMDRADRHLLLQYPRHLEKPRGTFSLRSPVRPNPIAMAPCELIGMSGRTLTVLGVDCLDGTPLLDIKPYFTSTDAIPAAGKRGD
ncbi:MAG: tRNA (N6-threonylcarbamoyladenosine(37)-N6)-methyltransferase TrmO [Beijerinckiaceae bacterium]